MEKLLADCNAVIGCISPPAYISPAIVGGKPTGIMTLLNRILLLVFVVAGLFAFLNIILAGIAFISAGGDPKNITKAWSKIWQSLVGLLIIVTSFLIAAIIGMVFFGDWRVILQPDLTLK